MATMTLHSNKLTRAEWDAHGLDTAIMSLPHAINPIVKQDEYSLSFDYPLGTPADNELRNDRIVCADGQLYRIYNIQVDDKKRPLRMCVQAKHILYDLEHKDIVNIETSETTPGGIPQLEALNLILQNTPFTSGIVDTDVVLDYLEILQKDALWALNEQVLKLWGGELEVDNWTVSIRKKRGQDNGVQFRQGKNIKGISYLESIDEVITRLHVKGYKGQTFESINDGKDYIDSSYKDSYGVVREGYVTFSDDDLPNVLMQKGVEYLQTVEVPKVTIDIDLPKLQESTLYGFYKNLETVGLGDTITLHHRILKETVSIRVTGREYNPVTGNNLRLTISNDNNNLYTLLARANQNNAIIKAITNRKGFVRTESLRGVIDLLTTQIMASGSYTNAEVIKDKGALFENNDPNSQDFGAMYIGPGIFAIANSKKTDGSWDWRTFGNGNGFVGNEIIAGSITGDQLKAGAITADKIRTGAIQAPHIDSHAITANHISPEVLTSMAQNATGQQLYIAFTNGTVLDAENTATVAALKVMNGGQDITHRIPDDAIHWERISTDTAGDLAFNADPAHHGKTITIEGQDIDFHGILRCRIDETQLYSVPVVDEAMNLTMRDAGNNDAAGFRLADGILYYDGENGYTIEDGTLYVDMVVGAFVLDTTLQNLKTSYLSITRQGIEMYGSGFINLIAGSVFNMRAGSGAKSIGISNNRIDEFFQWAGAENPALAPYSVKMDGTVTATKLKLGMTNMTEITHGWTDGFRDDADSTHPITVSEYLNSDVLGVKKMLLTFKAEPVRATAKGAAAGGGATSSAGGGGERTSRSGGGATSSQTSQISIGGNNVRSGGATSTLQDHTHVTNFPTWYIPAHSHTVPSHTHTIDLPDHTHTVPNHTHPLTYGIYEGGVATQLRVYVDGNLAGTFDTNGAQELNITPYLLRTNGKVKRGAYHTVEITANALTRIVGSIYTQVLLGVDENEPIY